MKTAADAARQSYNAAREHGENIIGRRLAAARKAAGLKLQDVADGLAGFGLRISDKGVSKWELGSSVPNAYQLLSLCFLLGIDDLRDLCETSAAPLNAEGMRRLQDYREDLIASGRYRIPAAEDSADRAGVERAMAAIPVSHLRVSAGTGEYLWDEEFETEYFPASAVPDGTDFALYVSGNSMEPVYRDGQIVWVRRCSSLREGEVGVFICDGEGFLKEYHERRPAPAERRAYLDSNGVLHPQIVLLSYNPDYPPRVIAPGADFRIVGRALL